MGGKVGQEAEREKYGLPPPAPGGKIYKGGKLSNKLKHAQQVMDFLGHNYQGIAHAVKPVAKPIFGALTNKAVNAINPVQQLDSLGNSIKHLFGGAVRKRGRPRKVKGGKLSNKLKHAQQVLDFMGHNYQGIAHAVKPVAKPIFGALTNKAVNAINPVQQLDSLGNSIKHLFGGAVRKRGRPRKVKAGGALRQSGSTGGSMNYSGILY